MNKRKHMCATCIYRTDDRYFLALTRVADHKCHEDDMPGDNVYSKICAGAVGERGEYVGEPMFAKKWESVGREVMELTRRVRKRMCGNKP